MADNKRLNIKDLEALYAKEKELSELKIKLLEDERSRLSNVLDAKRRIAIEQEIANERQKLANSMQDAYNDALNDGYEISKRTTNALERRIKQQKELINNHKKIIKNKQDILKLQDKIAAKTKMTWQYLMDSDKAIRSTILNLGMSVAKAEEMRLSFEQSAGYVTRLGGGLGDIQIMIEGFADETGRARALSAEMVKDITLIGKGIGLGIEQATRLAAQFEYMGVNVKNAMDYAQGVVETAELMGINTNKVLKNITDNFKTLQKFTFIQGVKGFAQMAQYAEKFSINMESALSAAETARNLENAIDLAAQLQVMGGEFAKTDPFQLLFLSRNDPAAFTKKINEMTKGVVSFRKMADGTFEKFISPADRDRLAAVAKSLEMSTEELVEQSLRMTDIQKMRQQMIGTGLSDREKQLVEGMATFDSNLGRFTVQIAGHKKDIAELSAQEIKMLDRQSKSLEERALAAQTFDDAFRATIEEFKTILLPMLQGVNKILTAVRPVVIKITDFVKDMADSKAGWLKVAGMLMGAGALWKLALQPLLGGAMDNIVGGLSRIPRVIRTGISGKMPTKAPVGKAKGLGGIKSGLGVGAAAAGIGGGIAIAAEGLSALADSLSKLTPEQAKTLESIAKTLAITFPAAAIGIAVVAAVAAPAAGPLLALGAALLMIGGAIGVAAAGIGIMTTGIGKMSTGFATLLDSAEGMGGELFSIAAGIGAISIALTSMAVGGFGLPVFAATLGLISRKSDDIEKIGTAFGHINAVLNGSRENLLDVERAIKNISNTNLNNLNQFSQLKNIFNKPLQVEFSDKEVAMVSNITLNIDGYKFVQKLGIPEKVPIIQKELLTGKESGRG